MMERSEEEKGFGFHVRGSCPVIVSHVVKGEQTRASCYREASVNVL